MARSQMLGFSKKAMIGLLHILLRESSKEEDGNQRK